MPFSTDDLREMLWVQRALDGRQHEFRLSEGTAERIRLLKCEDGSPVWESGTNLILGFPARVDPGIPDGELRIQCLEFLKDVTVYFEDACGD